MARNTLDDLQDHLFMELERLNDCESGSEELEREIERARAVAAVAEKAIDNANTALRVCQAASSMGVELRSVPRMLGGSPAHQDPGPGR